MVTVHEFAHALAGVAMSLHPTVYPDQVVNTVNATTSQQVIQLLSGPVGSLVTVENGSREKQSRWELPQVRQQSCARAHSRPCPR
jgi:hypothetical protein